jgi:cytochrome c biogenesis protein CcdA
VERLFGDLQTLLQGQPWLAVPAVFVGGLLTASNPCVLAMVPLMMGMVAGYEDGRGLGRAFKFALFFVLGLAVTFTSLGLISALMGRMFGDVGSFWKYLVAAVCLVMGLHLLGVLKFHFNTPRLPGFKKGGLTGALLLGLLFGVVSTPCAVPILAVLLAYVAGEGNVVYGGVLLFIYALGHSALILIAGTSMGAAKRLLESKGLRKANLVLQKIAGAVIILVGAYFSFGR